jgi:hypothetical protein
MLISLLPFIDALKCYIVENDGAEKVCVWLKKNHKRIHEINRTMVQIFYAPAVKVYELNLNLTAQRDKRGTIRVYVL